MRFLLLPLITVLLCLQPAMAELYRWVDNKGNVHFSDKPQGENAELYVPPPIQTVPAGPTGSFEPPKTREPVRYKSLEILQPANDEVFLPDKPSIRISVRIDPRLDVGSKHQIAIFLNGQLSKQGNTFSHSFPNLDRGSYTAVAAVVDDKGNRLINSPPVTFHVKRHHK